MTRVAALIVLLLAPIAAGQGDSLRDEIDVARKKIYPTLVNIEVVARDFEGGRAVRVPSAGSGTIISAQGHVLTNYHVARDATRITCTLTTGEQIRADVVAHDPPTDLSVLQLRLSSRPDGSPPLGYASLGDSSALEVGDQVLAVGNPLSLSSSMTLGIVSNTARVFGAGRGGEMEDLEFEAGNKTGMFTRWIQHDALILPGNSGGPLVDLTGAIVGVNTRAGNGYGFATPASLVSRVLSHIFEHGKVMRGFVGISLLPVGKLKRACGALVAGVSPASPAAEAGVVPGDILTSIAGSEVVCRFLEEVPLVYGRLADLAPSREAKLCFERDGESREVVMKVAPVERYLGREIEMRSVGVTVREVTAPLARALRLGDARGVIVTGVRPGRAFEEAKPAIGRGDVVLRIEGEDVGDLKSFRRMMAAARESGDKVGITFRRDREVLVTAVDLTEETRPRRGGELAKAWLGIRTQVLTPDVAGALGMTGRKGFRVTEVYPHTAAARAGLATGDLLVAVDDEVLEASRPQDSRDLKIMIENMSIGDEIEVKVVRGDEELTLDVELEATPEPASQMRTHRDESLEMTVRELTFMDRVVARWKPDQAGVMVTEAATGGQAAMAGLGAGDLVVEIEGVSVKDTTTFRSILDQVRAEKPDVIRFFVRRGSRTTFRFVEPDDGRR